MKLKNLLLIALTTIAANGTIAQNAVAHFDMSLDEGKISETVTGTTYTVASQLPATTIDGITGQALRFDGYSNFVRAGLPVSTLSTETLTMRVVLAAETYPMMQVDVAETTPTFATICGNLDEAAKRFNCPHKVTCGYRCMSIMATAILSRSTVQTNCLVESGTRWR